VVWVWLTVFYKIVMQSQYIFTTVTGSPITGSFWTVTDSEPSLSSKYGNVPLLLKLMSIQFLKNSRAIKHSDISGTSKLLIIHFKQYGITAQSTALFIHALMYTIHTHALKRSHTHIHITHLL